MFGIFDLAFTKIVDPTIFVCKSFIFVGNSLALRAGAFFSACNSFAHRRQFSRASRVRVHPTSPRRRFVQVVEFRSRRCDRSPSLASQQQNEAAMDLLPGVASREGRRGGGDGYPSLASLQEKETAMDLLRPRVKKGGGAREKEKSRAWGGVVSRETTATWEVRARQGVQDSRNIKLPSHCDYAKMPSLYLKKNN